MADNNRRPEHPICGDANKQEDRDHDRRNEVFHGSSSLGIAWFVELGWLTEPGR